MVLDGIGGKMCKKWREFHVGVDICRLHENNKKSDKSKSDIGLGGGGG